ncbi:MAG: TIGR02147 family protein, partial [Bdellovibrio sp.]|nr:TIGR02147 family protein [Bdellovibrio sp.]
YRKSMNKNFSYATWSSQLGIKNKAYLRLMVLGRRPIHQEILKKLVEVLQLAADDIDYFLILAAYSQSKSSAEKEILGSRLVSIVRQDFEQEPLELSAEFLSHPLLPKLHSLLSFKDVKKDAESLARQLGVTAQEIDEAVLRLKQFGLLSEAEGDFTITTPNFKVSDKFKDQGMRAFYKNLFDGAEKAMDLPAEARRFRSLFFAMNDSEIKELNKRLDDFAKEVLARHDFSDLDGRQLYQLHYNFYPLSERVEAGKN